MVIYFMQATMQRWANTFEVRIVPGVTDIRDDQWHHVCVTYDRNQVIVYLDGEVEAAQDISTNFQSSPGHVLKFGYVNHNVGANEYFPGKMDELSIWNETYLKVKSNH